MCATTLSFIPFCLKLCMCLCRDLKIRVCLYNSHNKVCFLFFCFVNLVILIYSFHYKRQTLSVGGHKFSEFACLFCFSSK